MTVLFVFIPRIAWLFSDGHVLRATIQTIRLQYFYISRELKLSSAAFAVPYRGPAGAHTLHIVNKNDLSALWEIFIKQPYKIVSPKAGEVVVDLGANFGESTLFFLHTFPGIRVVAVEPSPASCARLKEIFKADDRVTVVNKAVAATSGSIDFYVDAIRPMRSSLVSRSEHMESVSIPAVTLAGLLAEADVAAPVAVLKYDIEGGEEQLFTDMKPATAARELIGEFHRDLVSVTLDDFVALFDPLETVVLGDKTGAKQIIHAYNT